MTRPDEKNKGIGATTLWGEFPTFNGINNKYADEHVINMLNFFTWPYLLLHTGGQTWHLLAWDGFSGKINFWHNFNLLERGHCVLSSGDDNGSRNDNNHWPSPKLQTLPKCDVRVVSLLWDVFFSLWKKPCCCFVTECVSWQQVIACQPCYLLSPPRWKTLPDEMRKQN